MSVKRFQTRIALKRDTEANWYGSNIVLLDGEIGIGRGAAGTWSPGDTSTTIDNFKVGDGTKVWKQLWYAIPEIKTQTIGTNGETLTSWTMAAASDRGGGRLREYSLTGINSNIISLYLGQSGAGELQPYYSLVPDWLNYSDDAPSGTFGNVSRWLINHDYAIYRLFNTLNDTFANVSGRVGEVVNYVNFSGDTTHYSNTFSFGSGLYNSNAGQSGAPMTVSVKPKANGYISVTADGVDVTNIDSNYTAANTTNLATVATVTAAIGGLNTGVVSVGGAQGVIGVGNGLQIVTNSNVNPATNTLTARISTNESYLGFDTTETDGQRGLYIKTHTVSDASNTSAGNGLATAYDVKTYVDSQILNTLDSEVTFKGVTGTKPTSGINNGDMWKTSAAITFTAAEDEEGDGFTTKAGDTIIAKVTGSTQTRNTTWYLIPSADDVEDTWRPVYVQSTQGLDSAISGGSLVFEGGGGPVQIQYTLPTQNYPNLTVSYQHGILNDPSEDSPWTLQGAVKIKTDSWGHVRTDGAITASDVIRTATSAISSTTVEGALAEIAGHTNGLLNTTNTTPQVTDDDESLRGTVNLHKVAKTGTITDLYQTAPANGNTVDLVILDCGTASTNTNSDS